MLVLITMIIVSFAVLQFATMTFMVRIAFVRVVFTFQAWRQGTILTNRACSIPTKVPTVQQWSGTCFAPLVVLLNAGAYLLFRAVCWTVVLLPVSTCTGPISIDMNEERERKWIGWYCWWINFFFCLRCGRRIWICTRMQEKCPRKMSTKSEKKEEKRKNYK